MTTFEKIRTAALARLDAGEPAHIILQDYADYETELRPILENATGKKVKPLSSHETKIKAKNQAKSPLAMLLLAAGLVVLLGIGAVIFGLGTFTTITSTEIVSSQSEVTCIGIPQAQITSPYVLQGVTQTPAELSSRGSGGGIVLGGRAVEESSAPVADEAAVDYYEDSVELEEAESDDYAAGDTALSSIAPAPQQNEPLRAGEIDDNADWDTYQSYRRDYLDTYGTQAVRDVDTTDRQIIRVVDQTGAPIHNACVEIYNGDAHIASSLTYATGLTMFLPNVSDQTRYVEEFRVVVSAESVTVESTIERNTIGGTTTIELPITQTLQTNALDVMFLLDATGSMADEILQLQDNILTISEQIDQLPYDVSVRYGLVTYLDRGDVYVTRTHPFTTSVSEFQDLLLQVQAQGGGDYPESLNQGFDAALNAVDWRMDNAIRLIFLVADAPPHIDYPDDADYSLLMQDALARGIKVHPIASGGLEPEGEFVLRQIAQVTMGRFLFLTYDDGIVGTVGDDRPDLAVGDPKDEQGVGDYSVSQLDELVLSLIIEEIEAANRQ